MNNRVFVKIMGNSRSKPDVRHENEVFRKGFLK